MCIAFNTIYRVTGKAGAEFLKTYLQINVLHNFALTASTEYGKMHNLHYTATERPSILTLAPAIFVSALCHHTLCIVSEFPIPLQ